MLDLRKAIGLEYPLIQAGMGGGIARSRLAAAVSLAGGLGTIGYDDIDTFQNEICLTKKQVKSKPYSANLLMPFATKAHLDACIQHKVPLVSLFFGFKSGWIDKLKSAGCLVAYQVGTLEEANRVVQEGVDLLIVQGSEAGGHVRGTEKLCDIVPKVRAEYPDIPIYAAGGIYNGQSAAQALSYGANGVSVGTRFLMSDEASAHEDYKKRLCLGETTILTSLFGLGWPAPHRVLKNEATRRWIDANNEIPSWVQSLNQLSENMTKYVHTSPGQQLKIYAAQKRCLPLYTPIAPVEDMVEPPIEFSALYAGACVKHIREIAKAADIVQEISKGLLV